MRALQRIMLLMLLAGLLAGRAQAQATPDDGFADGAFRALWQRTDDLVARGAAGRSWTWGERAGERRYERYAGAPGGARLVQYLDKARMEITQPAGDRSSPWYVTNGLLVVELISGRLQSGDAAFESRAAAQIPIAGDPHGNPDAPTYASLAELATVDGGNRAAPRVGQRVSVGLRGGVVEEWPGLGVPPTEIVRYEEATGHNVPRVFHDFMTARGPVREGGRTIVGPIVDALFAFGYPITEPYWVTARVGGVERTVLFQAFERRVLTYTPANPDPWQVEMGNVGQHYMLWRYGHPLRYAQPPLAEGLRSWEGSVSIPTYDYERAYLPPVPGDLVAPYPRIDRSRVGPPVPRSYRIVVVENRFLELSFMPELGGRLYSAVDKATGHNIFYKNPVIKPSPFGQRGWWLGPGGLEWAMPTEEHGYLEYLPWELSTAMAGASMRVSNTFVELQTGMRVTGMVDLAPDAGSFDVTMAVANATGSAHPLQMWTNAMLSPGGANAVGPGVRFVAPTSQLIVHATQDPGLPGAQALIGWPSHNGRDLSRPISWGGYLGAFAPAPIPFLAAYDTLLDEGAAVIHDHPSVQGSKLFAFSPHFDRSLYTDDGSEYLELWSGAQRTFWDYPPLQPQQTRAIETRWLPLWGIGDLATASRDGALGLTRRADGATVALASPRIARGVVVVVRVEGAEVFRTAPLDLRPDMPLAIDLPALAPGALVEVEAGALRLAAR